MKPLPCLVFDLDGTISDPSVGIARSFEHAFARGGHPPVATALIVAEIGPPLDASFRKLAPGVDEAEVVALVAAFRERYGRVGYAENTVYADMPGLIERLRERGFRLGVCTSKRRDFAVRILELFGLEHAFEFVSGGDIGIPKGQQLEGLRGSGAIDDAAVMIGDRAVDIVAAASNGLRSIGVLWGFGSEAELRGASPSALVSTPAELEALLASDPRACALTASGRASPGAGAGL